MISEHPIYTLFMLALGFVFGGITMFFAARRSFGNAARRAYHKGRVEGQREIIRRVAKAN